MPSLEQFSVRSSSPGSDSSAFFADLRCFGNSVLEGKMRIIVVPGVHGTGTLPPTHTRISRAPRSGHLTRWRQKLLTSTAASPFQ